MQSWSDAVRHARCSSPLPAATRGPNPPLTGVRGGNRSTLVTNSPVAPQASPFVSAPRGDVGSRFAAARRVESLGRLRSGTLLLLPPLTLALAVDVRTFGDATPVRALALIGMLGLA